MSNLFSLRATIINCLHIGVRLDRLSPLAHFGAYTNAMKNFTLLKLDIDGIQTYTLLGEYGEERAFRIFMRELRRESAAPNTIKAYARGLAVFFDYFYEACKIQDSKGVVLSRYEVREIIDNFAEYLMFGRESNRSLARSAAISIGSSMVSQSTCALYNAALEKFLTLSDEIRQEDLEFAKFESDASKRIDENKLYSSQGKSRALSFNEKRKMAYSSMFSGVIAGGAKKRRRIISRMKQSGKTSIESHKIFPLNNFSLFVSCLPSFRDKAYYCFLAASGCRGHEGLQLLADDIDVKEREVVLVDPKSRINHKSYLYLNSEERALLSWKGRKTDQTYLLEPFASMFWENLRRYLSEEYVYLKEHNFIFQVLRGEDAGRPYFLTTPTTRREVYRSACKKSNVPLETAGGHSLRHSYVSYLVNYHPRQDGGYGLPIGLVKSIVGHSNLDSTEIYSHYDKEMIKAQLALQAEDLDSLVSAVNSPTEYHIRRLLALARKLGWQGDLGGDK